MAMGGKRRTGWPLEERPPAKSPEGEEFHDKPCPYCFSGNPQPFAWSAWPEFLTTALTKTHGAPQRAPSLQNHRGRTSSLDRSQCEAVQNLDCSSMATAPAIAARSIAGVQPERPNGGVQGWWRLSRAPAQRSHPRWKVAALIRSKARGARPSLQIRFVPGVLQCWLGLGNLRPLPRVSLGDSPSPNKLLGSLRCRSALDREHFEIFSAHATGRNTRAEIENAPLALDGSVGFVCLDGTLKLRLPMGSRLQIESAGVQDGKPATAG